MASLITHLVTDSFRILAEKLNTNFGSLNSFAFVTSPASPITANFTAWSDDTSSFNASYYDLDGVFTLTMPAATSTDAVAGRVTHFKNSGSGTVTFSPTGGDTFDGASSFSLLTKQSIWLKSDGISDWQIN